MTYKYGQKLINRKTGLCAYVASKNPESEYLIKMSMSFPEDHLVFFVHASNIKKFWTTQPTIFETVSNSLQKMRQKLKP